MFCQVNTQWRVVEDGPYGLDYNVLFDLMDRRGYAGREWDRVFEDIQTMERAAIKAMRKSKTK